jgi:uncharacterized protein YggE
MKWLLLTVSLAWLNLSWAEGIIEVTGHANFSIPADYVEVNIGLDSRAKDAGKAARDNAKDMARLVTFLQNRHILAEDMRTTQLSLQANHDYQRNVITGYQANRTLHIKVRDFSSFDALLVDLAQRGGNRLHGYQAKLNDPQDWQTKLLEAANSDALHKATTLAQANQRQLGPVTYISEINTNNTPRPMFVQTRSAMADAAPVPTSLQAGSVQLSKQLLVRYTLHD